MTEETTAVATPDEPKIEVISPNASGGSDLSESLNNISKKLMETLNNVVEDMSTLEVQTYTSKDLERSSLVKLRAKTSIRLDGDVDTIIPERPAEEGALGTEIDEKVWAIHKEMVDMAQDKRVAFIQAIAEVARALVKD